ncbi:MAG: branched-chain amino acid ABC transporter permease [Anaerolineae bacterium]|nr:branched-chain amino acid ABC transporter permease [Anaerolineae bacterium]
MKAWSGSIGFVIVGVLLALVPWLKTVFGFPTFYLIFLYFIFFWVAQASAWNILSGYSGYFSFGQGAFYGVGIYVMATMVDKYGANFLTVLPFGGIAATLLGLGIGFVVFRLRLLKGELFALLTLAVDFVLAALVRNNDFIDGGFGVRLGSVKPPEFLGDFSTMMYILSLIIALLTVYASYAIYNSRFGLGLFSIRDDEEVAEGLGVPTFRYKMFIFGISCFFIGLSGALHALQIGYITVEGTFSLRVPLFVILMSVLGGRNHWLGPVLGAIIIHTLTDTFSKASIEYLNQIIIGSLLIVMILFLRDGIYERLKNRIWPSLIILIIALLVQTLGGLGDRFLTQLAYAMLITIALLLFSDNIYQKFIGPFRFLQPKKRLGVSDA